MPRVGKKDKSRKKRAGGVTRLPKKKCCESKTRCDRCPLRMLKEGTLPPGYTVHKRKLVTVDEVARRSSAKRAKKAGQAA